MSRLLHYVDSTSEWTGKIAGFLSLFMIGIICYEVLMRYLFTRPTLWVNELSQYLFGALFMFGAAYTLRLGAFVNLDLVSKRLSPRGRAIMDLVTFILFCLVCGVLLWKGWYLAWKSIQIWERSDTAWGPVIWPVRLIIPIGAFLILVQGLAKFIRDLSTAVTGGSLEH